MTFGESWKNNLVLKPYWLIQNLRKKFLSIEIIKSKIEWDNFLKEVENYDFYHTYDYNSLSKSDNETPILLKYKENDVLIGIPLLLRNIPNTQYKDETCVYGYLGPISKNIPDGFDNSQFKEVLFKYLNKNNIITVFSRFNPYIKNQHLILNNIGLLINKGQVVNINIQLDLEKQEAEINKRLKTYINTSRRSCSVRMASTKKDIQEFMNIYHENMDRVSTKELILF